MRRNSLLPVRDILDLEQANPSRLRLSLNKGVIKRAK